MRRPPFTADRCRGGGFSLFELLVVIALFSVLTGLGSTVFFRMTDLSQRLKTQQELGRRADDFFDQLQQDLDDLLPASLAGQTVQSVTREAEDPQRYFDRSLADDTLRLLLAPAGPDNAPLSPRHVTYRVDRTHHQLVRNVGEEIIDTLTDVTDDFETVRLRFEFAGQDNGSWRTGWSSQEPPRAIRTSLTVASKNQPDIQVSRKMIFAVRTR
ncbi:MAG: type II secretion system protein [Candidatus Hydrogenedentales bacterium]